MTEDEVKRVRLGWVAKHFEEPKSESRGYGLVYVEGLFFMLRRFLSGTAMWVAPNPPYSPGSGSADPPYAGPTVHLTGPLCSISWLPPMSTKIWPS